MAMENGVAPKNLESDRQIVVEEIAKWRKMLSVLGAGALAIATISSPLGKKIIDVAGEDVGGIDKSEQNSPSYGPSSESKEVPFSYTLQDVDGLLNDLDKKIMLGQVSDEQMKALIMMVEQDKEYKQYLKDSSTNPDGGTIETGGPVIGSEQVR